MIEMRMGGRCALITGGSHGIGFAAAMNFMRAGASVAIVARRPNVLEQARQALACEAKGKAFGIVGDVSKVEDCARIFAAAEKELGRVDLLLNNAGTCSWRRMPAATSRARPSMSTAECARWCRPSRSI